MDAVSVPLSVDGESLFSDRVDGIGDNVAALAELGAAGLSIEDYDADRGVVLPLEEARERVAAAAAAARGYGVVLTARAENHLNDRHDLDGTLARLRAYRDAGADVVHAPGLADGADIRRVVDETGAPVNVLLLPAGLSPDELATLGVRRVRTGGRLARIAYETAVAAAERLLIP